MGYRIAHKTDVGSLIDEEWGGMWMLRGPLECEHLGVSIIELEPGGKGMRHDHAEDGHEEVYVVVEGAASIAVDGESVPLSQGDAARLAPDVTRQVRAGDDGAVMVLAGAP